MALLLALALCAMQEAEPAQGAVAEPCPPALRIEPPPIWMTPGGSALGSLEQELVSLHTRLRPSLVKVALEIPIGRDDAGEPEIHQVLVSGVVIDRGGVFVAPGLVEGLSEVRVTRFDGEVFRAQPLAQDKEFGLSLFRAPELAVPPPALGWPASLRVGLITVSLGNAFDLDGTLDVGFIAGLNRRVDEVSGLIQLTNTVNPGDGGGLVANRQGQVIGLLKTSLREVGHQQVGAGGHAPDCPDGCGDLLRSESLSFAIPIEKVLLAFEKQLSFRVPRLRWLGVSVRESYLPELAAQLGAPGPTLLRLDEILPGSPARAAGLQPDDVLVRFGGLPLAEINCLRHALAIAPAGKAIEVVYFRDGVLASSALKLGWSKPKDVLLTDPAVEPPRYPGGSEEEAGGGDEGGEKGGR